MPVLDNCILSTLEHSSSVGRAAGLETRLCRRAGPQVWNRLLPNLRLCGLSYGQFRRLLKTDSFGQWDRSTVWTVLTAPNRNILTCLVKQNVISFCGQSHCCNRPYYLTVRFQPILSHVASAKSLSVRSSSLFYEPTQIGSCQISCLWIGQQQTMKHVVDVCH